MVPCGLVIAFVLSLLFGETPAWAQQPNPKGTVKKGTDKKDKTKDNKPADELIIDSESLPKGYQPPPERLAIMDLEKPIATKEELVKLKKESAGKFFKVKNDCDLSEAGKKVVRESIRFKLGLMTLKDDPTRGNKDAPVPVLPQLPQLRKGLVDDIANVGGNPAVRQADKDKFVDFINKEVVRQTAELLTNNFYVRLQAVYILGEMDYAGAYELLLKVLQAKDIKVDPTEGQPQSIKIPAAMGLIRILRFAKPEPEVRIRAIIAHAVIEELKQRDTHWWYQVRLIEALRYCNISGVDSGDNNKPFVVQALLDVIKDEKRSCMVRAKACYAIGRVPLPGVKAEDVAMTIAEFALQLATAAAADPKRAEWKYCFWDLYLAFIPRDPKDMDAENKIPGGLMARAKNAAKPVYDLILPLVQDVIHGKAPDPASRQKLEAFVATQKGNGALTQKRNQDVTDAKQ